MIKILPNGHTHPITQFFDYAVKIFTDLGFEISEGPLVVDEYANFDSLLIPKNHPARDLQDTFWLTDGRLLRTHTSAMQVKSLENKQPPVKIIIPGRCFRHEATDSSHEINFYQLEGFAIDKDITLEYLIGTLNYFFKQIFGDNIQTRVRSGYFAFVEPGIEMDIKIGSSWQEILGAGMIHPGVLKNMGIDSDKWSGFAFGMGIDRLMMLKRGINDIRLSYSGDLRFLKQF